MTGSRDPKPPRKGAKTGDSKRSSKGHSTPLSRRLKYFVQDLGYGIKKASRRLVDPIRDTRQKRPRPTARRPAATKPEAKAASAKAKASTTEAPAKRRKRRSRRKRSRPLAKPVAFVRRGFGWLAAAVTPLRAAVAVTAVAAILLTISQFVEYRTVVTGADYYAAYEGLSELAPPVESDRTGEAHSYVMIPLAVVSLILLVFALLGRWQLGRVVSLLGLVVIGITLLVDRPAGLEEGDLAIAYGQTEARLQEGFYAQLAAGAVLVIGGLLVSRYARRSARSRSRASRRRAAIATPRARAA